MAFESIIRISQVFWVVFISSISYLAIHNTYVGLSESLWILQISNVMLLLLWNLQQRAYYNSTYAAIRDCESRFLIRQRCEYVRIICAVASTFFRKLSHGFSKILRILKTQSTKRLPMIASILLNLNRVWINLFSKWSLFKVKTG